MLGHHELGLMAVMVNEFERHRLPRLLGLRAKVMGGDVLSDIDFDYLTRMIHDAHHDIPIAFGHPVLEEFCTHICHLYYDICELALINEQKSLVH